VQGQGGSSAAALLQDRLEGLLDKCVMLLLAFSRSDAVVKGYMCTAGTLQPLFDCIRRLPQPHLLRVSSGWMGAARTGLAPPVAHDEGRAPPSPRQMLKNAALCTRSAALAPSPPPFPPGRCSRRCAG
jgi:hypothetical protein